MCVKIFRDFWCDFRMSHNLICYVFIHPVYGTIACLNISASKMVLYVKWSKETRSRFYPGTIGLLMQFPASILSYNQMRKPISNVWLTLVSLLIHITFELSVCVCKKYKRTLLGSLPPPLLLGNITQSQLLTPVCLFPPLSLSKFS